MHLPKSFPLANTVEQSFGNVQENTGCFCKGSAMTQVLWMGSSLASILLHILLAFFSRAEQLLGWS